MLQISFPGTAGSTIFLSLLRGKIKFNDKIKVIMSTDSAAHLLFLKSSDLSFRLILFQLLCHVLTLLAIKYSAVSMYGLQCVF
jgi:hypothetical protein